MKTKLLLFDFDGTLFNTSMGIHKAVNIVAQERGVEEFPLELVQQLIGQGLDSLIAQLDDKSAHKLGQLKEFRDDFRRVYREIALESSEIYPGAVEFLKSWDGELGIVSNKSEAALHLMVDGSELAQFNWLTRIGGDSLAEKKPHPLPLEIAMKKTGFTTLETLLVGDGIPDAQAARAISLPFIGVRFGYGPESELIQNGCRFFIDSYSDLPEQIQAVDASRKDTQGS